MQIVVLRTDLHSSDLTTHCIGRNDYSLLLADFSLFSTLPVVVLRTLARVPGVTPATLGQRTPGGVAEPASLLALFLLFHSSESCCVNVNVYTEILRSLGSLTKSYT